MNQEAVSPEPVVVPGRVAGPVGYGVLALLAIVIGGSTIWLSLGGDRDSGDGGPGEGARVLGVVVGAVFLLAGLAGLWWVLRKVERRIDVFGDRIVRRHLLGSSTTPLGTLAAVIPVIESRPLPRSRIERPVHRLRLIQTDGVSHVITPARVPHIDHGAHLSEQFGEVSTDGSVVEPVDARAIRAIHGLRATNAVLHRTLRAEVATWTHPGDPLLTTLLFREPIDGRHVVAVERGRVSINAAGDLFAIGHGDHVLMLARPHGSPAVRSLPFMDRIVKIDAGFTRVVTDGPEQHALVEFDDAESRARQGWPPQPASNPVEQLPTALEAPWMRPLQELLEGVFNDKDTVGWMLLGVGALEHAANHFRVQGDQQRADLVDSVMASLMR